jgi:hypothetical protein
MMKFKNSIYIWFGFLVLAFINGAFKELVLVETFEIPKLQANQLSCLSGVLLWTILFLIFWKKLKIQKLSHAVYIGLFWLVATFIFETFILGRNLSWTQILRIYDIPSGQYWGLVLLWIGLMPPALFMIKGRDLN